MRANIHTLYSLLEKKFLELFFQLKPAMIRTQINHDSIVTKKIHPAHSTYSQKLNDIVFQQWSAKFACPAPNFDCYFDSIEGSRLSSLTLPFIPRQLPECSTESVEIVVSGLVPPKAVLRFSLFQLRGGI